MLGRLKLRNVDVVSTTGLLTELGMVGELRRVERGDETLLLLDEDMERDALNSCVVLLEATRTRTAEGGT